MRTRLAALACILLLVACSAQTGGPVRDLVDYEQDTGAYHGLNPLEPLLPPVLQERAYAHFLGEHFAPWERARPKYTADEVFWGFKVFGPKRLFGENTLEREAAWIETMREKSQVNEYPLSGYRAIAVTNTSMRVFPTHRPAFYDFSKPGEGFPFDYMQNSLVLTGTPLFVSHRTADGAWLLVESRFAFGWVPAGDVAWVTDEFAALFRQTGRYGAVIRDDVPVRDAQAQYRFTAHIGTLLPLVGPLPSGDGYLCMIPVRDKDGEAQLHMAELRSNELQPAPLAATPVNFSRLANRMIGRQYGWGGMYEDRDCSATTMDLMVPFGLYLPRNSKQQYEYGTVVTLDGLTRAEKKHAITELATPFLTLIRKRGHIMVYIGQKDGQPMVFHSVWGLKTRQDGEVGRKIIGSTVVTSLEPGTELDNLARPEGILLETVYGMSTLPGSEEVE